jgi:hypothetical protein
MQRSGGLTCGQAVAVAVTLAASRRHRDVALVTGVAGQAVAVAVTLAASRCHRDVALVTGAVAGRRNSSASGDGDVGTEVQRQSRCNSWHKVRRAAQLLSTSCRVAHSLCVPFQHDPILTGCQPAKLATEQARLVLATCMGSPVAEDLRDGVKATAVAGAKAAGAHVGLPSDCKHTT